MKGAFGLECGAAAKGWGDDQITLGHIHITHKSLRPSLKRAGENSPTSGGMLF